MICLRSHSRSVTEPRIRRLATSCQQDVHCLKLRAEFLWGWNARSSAGLLPAAERSHAGERWLYFLQGSLCGAWAQPWCRTEPVCTRDILQIITTNHSICQQRDVMGSLPSSFLLLLVSCDLLIGKKSFLLCCSLVLIHDVKSIFPLHGEARNHMWTWNMFVWGYLSGVYS